MKIFYFKNFYATRLQAGGSTSIFRHQQLTLASYRHSLPVKLQAVDSQFSALVWQSPDQFEFIAFGPYGQACTFVDLIGFKGEPVDITTGNYLLGNGHRAYSPVNQRFNSSDSHSPFGLGGLNSYAFVGNDPINRNDPTGRFVGHVNPLMGAVRAITALKNQVIKLFSPQPQIYAGRGRMVDGILAFSADSLSRGSSRVYILAHGGPGYINGKSRSYDGAELYSLFEDSNISLKGRKTLNLVCRSAVVDPLSGLALNQSIANNTRAASAGFPAKVRVQLSSNNHHYQAQVIPPELIEWYFDTHTDRPIESLPQLDAASRSATELRRS